MKFMKKEHKFSNNNNNYKIFRINYLNKMMKIKIFMIKWIKQFFKIKKNKKKFKN